MFNSPGYALSKERYICDQCRSYFYLNDSSGIGWRCSSGHFSTTCELKNLEPEQCPCLPVGPQSCYKRYKKFGATKDGNKK